ncbi:M20 family metallopeptidase [Amycolatopsis acidicola]|uniref:Peptidase M20 domain-containing protein 2 n=1 Tax=Amycolatopsis acidicola TaxID=2596893 RepID=A0A5N0UWA8_9PSEU|nr:amidohydrolase [Amycolatopsis acidicola]KAA9157330.1 M20 family metallopeptidase [Amycolatopsis acidicola]
MTTDPRARIIEIIDERAPQLIELSHAIHANPELSYEERDAARLVARAAEAAGFATEVGAYGVKTAVEAVAGEGDLTVVVCAEYDALPDIGHACGHNMIAATGVGAAIALKAVAAEAGLRVKLLGTPAEEHGGGKVDLLLAGAWEDAAFSMMVHGSTGADAPCDAMHSTAVERIEVEFTGRAAHAAGFPEQGINAGAAATVALTALGLLRQQLTRDVNVNAFISHGGEATNIIPARTVIQLEVRAYDLDEWRDARRRVLACFEAGALATGCEWKYRRTENPYAPLAPHAGIAAVWNRNLEGLGRTLDPGRVFGGGSTDMGNVSQVLPAIHPMVAIEGSDAVGHHADFAAAAATPAADKAVLDGAKALALTALDVALDGTLRSELLELRRNRPAGATRKTLEA